MATTEENRKRNTKQQINVYNLLLNLFWSALSFVPLCVFCFEQVPQRFLFFFAGISILPAFLSKSAIDRLKLAKSAKTYKNLGVLLVQYLSQNGVFINNFIRKRHPGHQVIRKEKRSIEGLLKQTYVFEKFHLCGLVLFGLTSLYALSKTLFGWALVLTLINVVYNLYPILLQQYIRLKLAGYKKKDDANLSAPTRGLTNYRLKCMG